MAQRRIVYQSFQFDISYEKCNAESSAFMVFLHGWGSNKEIMQSAFSKCFKNFCHIYIDMPGFGNSSAPIALTTQDYANIITQFMQEVCGEKITNCIIFGHSFGGKVALLCNPKELILLSSAGIRLKKPLKTRIKIKLAKIFRTFGLSSHIFRASDVKAMNEVMYHTFKNVVNEDFSENFTNFKHKAFIFWGKGDKDTPLICGEKIASLIENSRFFMLDGEHYFFLKQGHYIEQLYKEAHG